MVDDLQFLVDQEFFGPWNSETLKPETTQVYCPDYYLYTDLC